MTRIATFNVNGVNGRLPVLLKWLGQSNYDIVCLQELKTSDEKFPAEEIGKTGYGAIWHGQRSYNVVAILARERSRWNDDVACRAILTTPTAVTSRPSWMGLLSAVSTFQMAIQHPARSSTTSYAGSTA